MKTIKTKGKHAELKELLEHLTESVLKVIDVWGEVVSLSEEPLTETDVLRVRKNIHGMFTNSYNLMGVVLEVENKIREAKHV